MSDNKCVEVKIKRPHSFDILCRENGTLITSFETKDSIRLEIPTPKGFLIIDYKKYEDTENE